MTDSSYTGEAMKIARMRFMKVVIMILIIFVSALLGYFSSVFTSKSAKPTQTIPKVYVERCSFLFEGDNCGEHVKNAIFFASDEFLGFTEHWAVGRVDNYKAYMSCFGPGDDQYADGTYSTLTVVVAGSKLSEAHAISKTLMKDFSNELPEQSRAVAHCLEP